LERAASAREAVDVITGLLETYGQGGNCVQNGHLYYHNSYLMADARECWVLETVDRHWAARRVQPIYTISNLLSLTESWDLSSTGLEDYLLENKLAGSKDQIHLSKNLSDLIYTTFADGKRRCSRSHQLLERDQGQIREETMAEILRDHGGKLDPTPGITGAVICMHASLGPIRGSQSVGSLIASLQVSSPLIFATGTSAPCTGIFKPVWVDAPLELTPRPEGKSDPDSLFWSHERLHRAVIGNFPDRIAAYQSEKRALEDEFTRGARDLHGAARTVRQEFSKSCFDKAREAEERWFARVLQEPADNSLIHRLAWKKFNLDAEFSAG
jgi:dipeptidase